MASEDPNAIDSREAIQLIYQSNFHQCLFLPSSPTHERLRVTYAVTSNFSDVSLPVILYCGPMFASRYHAVGMDHLATAAKVRLIHVDRPGFGGSTRCSPSLRISVWLELVPVLLEKLDVKHVSLLSHSAGTHYLLNTLWHHRRYLDPVSPYAALITPWVHSEHSQVMLTSFLSKLPTSMVNSWNSVLRFVAGDVLPASAWSGGVFTAASKLFQKAPAVEGIPGTGVDEVTGMGSELSKEIEKAQTRFMLVEETVGVNDEVMLCLRKDGADFGACNDLPGYIKQVRDEEGRRSAGIGSNLKVQAFFAESDILIGKGGQKYFEDCWKQDDPSNGIVFESFELPGTNHDSAVADTATGALRRVFEQVQRSSATA